MQFRWIDVSYIEDIKPKHKNEPISVEAFKCNKGPDIVDKRSDTDTNKYVIEHIRHEEDNK